MSPRRPSVTTSTDWTSRYRGATPAVLHPLDDLTLGFDRIRRGELAACIVLLPGNDAELAVLVDDRFQHLGMGTELYRRLIAVAKDEKLEHVVSTILSENREMRAICQKLGFQLKADMEDGTIQAELTV